MKKISTLFCALCAFVCSVPCSGSERRVPLNNPFNFSKPKRTKVIHKDNATFRNTLLPQFVQRKKPLLYAPKQEQMIDVLSHFSITDKYGNVQYEMKYNDQGFLEKVICNGESKYSYEYGGFVGGRWTKRVFKSESTMLVEERKLDQAGRVIYQEIEESAYPENPEPGEKNKRVMEYSYDHNPKGVCVKYLTYEWSRQEQDYELKDEYYQVWFEPLNNYLEFSDSRFKVSEDGLSYSYYDGESYCEKYYDENGTDLGYLNVHVYDGEVYSVYGYKYQDVKESPQSGWNTELYYEADKKEGATDIENSYEWQLLEKEEFTNGYKTPAVFEIGKTEKHISYETEDCGATWDVNTESEWTYVTDHIVKVKEKEGEYTWEGYEWYDEGEAVADVMLYSDGSYMLCTEEEEGDGSSRVAYIYYRYYAADGTLKEVMRSFDDENVIPGLNLDENHLYIDGIERFQKKVGNQWVDITGNLLIGDKELGVYMEAVFDNQGRPLQSVYYSGGKMEEKDEYAYTDKSYSCKSFEVNSEGVEYMNFSLVVMIKDDGSIFTEEIEYFSPGGEASYRYAVLYNSAKHIQTNYQNWNEEKQEYASVFKNTIPTEYVNQRGENVIINYELEGDVAVPSTMSERIETPLEELRVEYNWDAAAGKWIGISKRHRKSNGVAVDFKCTSYESPLAETYIPTDYFFGVGDDGDQINLFNATEESDLFYEWDETANDWKIVHGRKSLVEINGNTMTGTINEFKGEHSSKIIITKIRDNKNRFVSLEEQHEEQYFDDVRTSSVKKVVTYDEKGRVQSENNISSYVYSDKTEAEQHEQLYEFFYTTIASDVEEQPAQQQWTIQGRTLTCVGLLKVYDLSGRLVMQVQGGSAQLPASGIYMIGCNGQTTKVVVK